MISYFSVSKETEKYEITLIKLILYNFRCLIENEHLRAKLVFILSQKRSIRNFLKIDIFSIRHA